MTILEKDPSLHNVFWWKPPAHFSWMDFHRAIDDMRGLVSNVAQPVIIAAQPQGDLPAGTPETSFCPAENPGLHSLLCHCFREPANYLESPHADCVTYLWCPG